ncbi:hypothetical protein GIB67_012021 [Kingdonia uniflora]|uniref:Ribosomal protein L34Ae n=1 Tax=Kingdonia uniflora TaxID=39325 RepID=A0A7J7M023_9MAGN|nr:hypothetical protein GIB67_012021 [Kingdonia uniflora]
MGTQKRYLMNTHLDCLNKGLVDEFFCKKMGFFVGIFWGFVRTYLAYVLKFISTYFFRLDVGDASRKENCNVLGVEHDSVPDIIEFEEANSDGVVEKESPKFSFRFEFQTSEDIIRSSKESDVVCVSHGKAVTTTSTSKYQFVSERDFSYFVEEPEVVSFSIKEFYVDLNKRIREDDVRFDKVFRSETITDTDEGKKEFFTDIEKSNEFENQNNSNTNISSRTINKSWLTRSAIYRETTDFDEDIEEPHFPSSNRLEREALVDREPAKSDVDVSCEDKLEATECLKDAGRGFGSKTLADSNEGEKESVIDIQKSENLENLNNSNTIYSPGSVKKSWVTRNDQETTDSDEEIDEPHFQRSRKLETEVLSERVVAKSKVEESYEEGLQVKEGSEDVGRVLGSDALTDFDEWKIESRTDNQTSEQSENLNFKHKYLPSKVNKSWFTRKVVYQKTTDFDEEIEAPHSQNSDTLETEVLTNVEFASKTETKSEEHFEEELEATDASKRSAEANSQNSSVSVIEDSELETEWEHQDLIEQLKLELKKVRATGLPTILEESESPKISEDFKPWKIEEKFLHEDQMGELHKFYKSYRERMRKFDILNYQKMYTIGVLQLKDPLQSASTQKSSTPKLTTILSRNLGLSKSPTPEVVSSAKFIKELQGDLEMVYVGQVCLSWEFLHWQYRKTRQLLETDPYETRQYNQVAGEFQQFQILMHRFMENESFQGPRVQNYIKNRCVLRNLLQVPVIKEDSKNKEGIRRRKDAITCSMLLQIIEESMRIFWEFLRADRDDGNVILKGLLGPQVELIDPTDSELFLDVQTILQKKDKKLKDILRSGNCIVKRFQKHHEGQQSDQLVFFSQVDLKLVWRVLKMPRITKEQLLWCHKKLSKISFVDRKIHVEASFLPFPC